MARKVSVIKHVREFIKDEGIEPLKKVSNGVYVIDFWNQKITVSTNPHKEGALIFELKSMKVDGVSRRRLHKICDVCCNEDIKVSLSGSSFITIKYEDFIYDRTDVWHAINMIIDTAKFVVEEIKSETNGCCNIIDMDREKLKKQKEEDARKKEKDFSIFGFKKSEGGQGLSRVAGMEDLKNILRRDFVSIVQHTDVAKEYGITPPNGILLYGPPGCGKTLLAERIAEECGLKYAIIKPSDLGSIYVHGSEDMINNLFLDAERQAPCLMILDEFDAMVPSRDSAGAEYQAEEINEFLVHLNNCAEQGIYVIAMTNLPERIDHAVLRKGRIDKCIYVPLPDEKTRAQLFDLSLKERLCAENIDVQELAKLTDKYSCSDIIYIVQETARTCFEQTLQSKSLNHAPINQAALIHTIEGTLPSVSAADIAKYDRVRENLNDHQIIKYGRRKLGF